MKHQIIPLAVCACIVAALSVVGCDKNATDASKNDSTVSASKELAAYAELENQMYFMATNTFQSAADFDRVSFAYANSLYKEAIQANPNNPGANLGAALTEVFGVYADPAVNDAVKRWEAAGNGTSASILKFGIPTGTRDMAIPVQATARNLARIVQTALNDPPTIAEMQTILRDRLLPRLDYALARLEIVEQNPTFEMRISGKMQGNMSLQPVYLDMTEVYLMDALVRGMKAQVEEFLVFRFDLASYTTKGVVDAIQQNNTTFFVLASDGATRAASVHSGLLTMISKVRSAVNFLKSETDNQSDDVIKRAGNGVSGVASNDLDTVLVYLTKVQDGLSTPQTVELKAADTDLNNYTIQVDAGHFLLNPPTNPKQQWLPTYTVDTTATGEIMWHWQAQDYASFNFPDPTFGGLFPGMTNATMKRLMYLDEAFGWQLNCWAGTNDWMQSYPSMTAWIVVNGTTYYPKPDRYGYYSSWSKEFHFVLTENAGQAAQLYVAPSGTGIHMATSQPLTVRFKGYDHVNAYVDQAPQNISASAYSYGTPYVSLSFGNWGTYVIEKDSTNTTFFRLDSVSTSFYQDYSVRSGKTYRYRAQFYPFSTNGWYYGILAWRPDNYTNTTSITVP